MKSVSYKVTDGRKIHTTIGVLSYRYSDDIFTFEYDESFEGYPFGDINVNQGRYFESNYLFGEFYIDDSWTRQRTVEKYNVINPDSNIGQLRLIEILSENNGSYEGMRFEKLKFMEWI